MAVPGQQCQVEVCREITKCGKRSRLPQSRPLRSEFSSMLHRTDGVELWRLRHGRRELRNCSLASTCRQIPHAKPPQTPEKRQIFAACPLLKLLIRLTTGRSVMHGNRWLVSVF